MAVNKFLQRKEDMVNLKVDGSSLAEKLKSVKLPRRH